MTKTALKSAMRHGEDAITLLTEDHKKEEEEKMFPKAKKAKVNTAALGAALIQRKHELQAKPSRSMRLSMMICLWYAPISCWNDVFNGEK